MKRLTRVALERQGRRALNDFTKKHHPQATTTDQLLGQTLGDCHDDPGSSSGGGNVVILLDLAI